MSENMTKAPVGRPREFDEDQVMSEIMSLFWKQGYEGTGLADIMAATGLQKGSLYKAYGSKRAMYVCSLKHYERQVVDGAVTSLTAPEVPARERLYNFLNAPIQAAWGEHDRRGCFLCNASSDEAVMDDETRSLIARGYGKVENALTVLIAQLRPGWTQVRITQAARLLLSIYSGLRVMSRAAKDRERLEGARDAAIAIFDGA